MKIKLCDESEKAADKLPEKTNDRSGIGVHYVDAYIKPMNCVLEDGRKVVCKRRGLKLTLKVGDLQGIGLMRRLENGPDVESILKAALLEAAKEAQCAFKFSDRAIFIELPEAA